MISFVILCGDFLSMVYPYKSSIGASDSILTTWDWKNINLSMGSFSTFEICYVISSSLFPLFL